MLNLELSKMNEIKYAHVTNREAISRMKRGASILRKNIKSFDPIGMQMNSDLSFLSHPHLHFSSDPSHTLLSYTEASVTPWGFFVFTLNQLSF